MSITALAVAIATCAFAFLMYRRITHRLDGLSMAHLTLSKTLQHMVSASMTTQPFPEPAINQEHLNETLDNQQKKSIVLNDNLGVTRIPVSDDDQTTSISNEDSDSDNLEDDDDVSSDNTSEMSDNDTNSLKNLNIMESLDDDPTEHLLTLELVASDRDVDNNSDEERIVELKDKTHEEQNDEQNQDDSDDSDDSDDDEELDEDDDIEDTKDFEQTQKQAKDVKESILSLTDGNNFDNIDGDEKDDIIAFSNSSENHYQTDLKQQKVETLRKMALDMNLTDEDSVKKMKKTQLVNMLNSQ